MNSLSNYPKYLQVSVNSHLKKYLDYSSREIILSQATLINDIIKSPSKDKRWSFFIDKDSPITFRGITVGGKNFEIDYYCDIEGDDSKITSNKFHTRVWTTDKNLCYRDSYDSQKIKAIFEKNGWKRVILRFRIESRLADVTHLELSQHMQIGGDQERNENCWIHENVKEPRILFPPMDFILFSEFVVLNYYFEKYQKLHKDTSWIRIVRNSQKLFQQSYYEKCQRMLNLEKDTETIVSHFCK